MPITKAQGKRDGLQKYRVRINYTDVAGEFRQVERTAYGMDAAKDLEYTLLKEYRDGGAGGSRIMTVRELYDEAVVVKAGETRETTLEKFKDNIELHVIPYLGDKKITKLNVAALQRWKTQINELGLALNTRKNIYSYFRSLMNYAVKMEYVPMNPLAKVGNFKDAYAGEKKIDYYTADEFKAFISAAKDEAERIGFYEWNYYVFFNIAFYTGARKGEIHALKWSDIYDGTMHIRRSIAQKLKGEDRETPPKNKSSIRDVQLPRPLINILEEHKQRYREEFDGFNEDFRVCGGIRPIRESTEANRNKRYADLAGVKRIRIHDFRHTHASLLANEGINIQEVARRLGHANIEMTWNTYSHLYPREEDRALAVLNAL